MYRKQHLHIIYYNLKIIFQSFKWLGSSGLFGNIHGHRIGIDDVAIRG